MESPFAASDKATCEEHREYLEKCLLDCVLRGETPYASHKMLTDCLDDNDPGQRRIGINAGMAMSKIIVSAGGKPVFYLDHGWSRGMQEARKHYQTLSIPYEERYILLDNPDGCI